MNNKIFISGKITGDDDYRMKFKIASNDIEIARRCCSQKRRCDGCMFHSRDYIFGCLAKDVFPKQFDVVNPAEFGLEGKPYWYCMLYCIWQLRKCSYVYMLADWQKSKGAMREHKFAKRFHKVIIYQNTDSNA